MTLPIFYYAQGTSWLFNEFGFTVGQNASPTVKIFGYTLSQGTPPTPIHVKGLDGQFYYWDGNIPNDPFPLMLDPTLWQYKRVQYPSSAIWIGPSIEIGVDWVIADILTKPVGTPFAIGGYSQGAAVASRIYNECRSGRLKDRRADLKAVVGFGNPMREVNTTYPGSSGYSGACDIANSFAGGAGMFPALDSMGPFDFYVSRFSRLIATEQSLFWNFTMPNEVISGVGNSIDGQKMQAFGKESLRLLPVGAIPGLVEVMGTLWQAYGKAPIDVLQDVNNYVKLVNPFNGNVTYAAGGGHIMYPHFPPPAANGSIPQTGLTCYQIALQYLRTVGQRIYDEMNPITPEAAYYPSYSWFSSLPNG